MSKPAAPGYDEISYRRGERRVLIRATSFGFLLIYYVKRVVGLQDDHVQMVRGRLSINGQLVALWAFSDERGREVTIYIKRLPDGTIYRIMKHDGDDGPLDNTPEFVVPPGHLFVMGDNRNNSTDSREQSPHYGVGTCLSNLSLAG